MRANFNFTPKTQRMNSNFIARTVQRNAPTAAIATKTNHPTNHNTGDNVEPFELPNIPLAYVLPRQNPPINNEQNDDLVTERCVHDVDDYDDLLETDVSDIDLLGNNQVDEMHKLINDIAGVDINRKLKIIDALNTTEEKKHDILMNDMILGYFKFIDTLQISDEEKFKRKLAFIDEAYYDPETRAKKHSEFVEAYNAKFTENK